MRASAVVAGRSHKATMAKDVLTRPGSGGLRLAVPQAPTLGWGRPDAH
jgi:hypothetical protein